MTSKTSPLSLSSDVAGTAAKMDALRADLAKEYARREAILIHLGHAAGASAEALRGELAAIEESAAKLETQKKALQREIAAKLQGSVSKGRKTSKGGPAPKPKPKFQFFALGGS